MKIPKIPFVSAKSLYVTHLSSEQLTSLKEMEQTVMSVTIPLFCSQLAFQTPVKNQRPRGSCEAFAFIGAVEARYKRDYGQDLDLSEEYLIHAIHSMQHSYNPLLHHENVSSWCGANREIILGFLGAEMNLNLPLTLEQDAPYFGKENETLKEHGTSHSYDDLVRIVNQNGIQCDYKDANGTWHYQLTQKAVDDFEYDPHHIPLDARKNCRYAVTNLQILNSAKTQDTAFLERIIADNYEVQIGLGLWRIDCGDGSTFSNGTAVSKHPSDGNPIAVWPQVGVNEDVNDPTNPQAKGVAGHSMLLCGYDSTRQLFLLKNSWGDYLPYIWVPYAFVQQMSSGGLIVKAVRDPNLGPNIESMWLGKWYVLCGGMPGQLVLRRTRKLPFNSSTTNQVDRLGTYYDSQDVPHVVTGFVCSSGMIWRAYLHIDFNSVEGSPDSTNVVINNVGQEFELEIFGSPDSDMYGQYAAGKTWKNGDPYGVLLSREPFPNRSISTAFNIDKWKGKYKLYISNGTEPDELEIIEICAANALYYPVKGSYNETVGKIAAIDLDNHIRLFFFGATPDLLYHGYANGVASGIGCFAERNYYLGNRRSKELHRPNCRWVKLAASSNLVYFDEIDEALQQGYNGCWYCLNQYDAG